MKKQSKFKSIINALLVPVSLFFMIEYLTQILEGNYSVKAFIIFFSWCFIFIVTVYLTLQQLRNKNGNGSNSSGK